MRGAAHKILDDVNAEILSQLICYNKKNVLIFDGHKADGKKKQYWEPGEIDLDLHIKGIKKQGGQLSDNGYSKNIVIDVDRLGLSAAEIGAAAYKIDNKLVIFPSPSGKKWHVWKFYNKKIPTSHLAKEAKQIEKEFKKLYGKDIDADKTQPTHSQIGINFPFCTKEQYPYSPAGVKLTWKQFLFRIKFQDHPLISMAAGLQEPGRHDALIIMAAYLHKNNMMENLDDVVDAMDGFDDEEYINRIKNKKIHEKYEVSNKAINKSLTNILGFDYELPAAAEEETAEELEVFEYTGVEKIKPRPWVIEGWALKKTLTLVVGQPGVGKTMFLAQLGSGLASGNPVLDKTILQRGNVLFIAAEETLNEINLRLKGIETHIGKNDGKFKIYKRGLENDLKLVNFTKTGATATKQYKQLQNTIRKKEIKYIILDPLINFQTGTYDENSNQNMDNYIKNYLIPLAVNADGVVFSGHHTNKISMVATHDNELLVDNQNALNAARGASSLIGAARFVLALQPMTRKLWEDHFKDHIQDGSSFVHYTGLIEAKSNYNVIAEEVLWCRKNTIKVATEDGFTEDTACFSTTELNKITKAKNKLKAAKNAQWCRSHMPFIASMFNDKDRITLNSIVSELVPKDPDFADGKVLEQTIKTRVRRKLENALSGKEETKDGYQSHGIAWEDGYNYWIARDHSSEGAAKVFIQRGKDFRRSK